VGWLGIADISFETGSYSSCLVPLDPYQYLLFRILSPLVFFLFLLLTMGCAYVWSVRDKISIFCRCRFRMNTAIVPFNRFRYFRTFTALISFAYTSLTALAIRYLLCVDINGESILYYYPAVSCSNSQYNSSFAIAIVLIIFLAFGFPSTVIIVLTLAHRAKKLEDDHWLERWSFLLSCYKKSSYYWEMIALLRRMVMSIVMTTIFDSLKQAQALLVLNFSVFALHVYNHPFKDNNMNIVESISLSLLLLISIVNLDSVSNGSGLSVGARVLLTMMVAIPLGPGLLYMGVDKTKRFCAARREKRRLRSMSQPSSELQTLDFVTRGSQVSSTMQLANP